MTTCKCAVLWLCSLRASNDYIEHVYNLLMSQLAQEHAEIRLSAFHMAAELFSRSHHFRLLLVSDFQDFLDLTVETDSDQPLPPPKGNPNTIVIGSLAQ